MGEKILDARLVVQERVVGNGCTTPVLPIAVIPGRIPVHKTTVVVLDNPLRSIAVGLGTARQTLVTEQAHLKFCT